MKLEVSEKKITVAEIEELERLFKVKLPAEFKKFYAENNGGEPSHPYIRGQEIQWFFSIKYGDKEDTIEGVYPGYRSENIIPDLFIPFAFDGGGWPFCMDLSNNGNGKIYLCPNGTVNREPIFIAQSFEDLISSASDVEIVY